MSYPTSEPCAQRRAWLPIGLCFALGVGACLGGSMTPGDAPSGATTGGTDDPNGDATAPPPTEANEPTQAPSPNDALAGTNNPNATPATDPNKATNANGGLQGPTEVSSDGDGNFVIGTNFSTDANLTGLLPGTPEGRWTTFYVPGANSKYYTGQMRDVPGLKQSVTINRQVQVFVPAQYKAGDLAPLLVLMDGGDFQYTLKTTLPNLIAQGALPPLVAITVSAGSTAGTYNQRSWEYDVVSTRWSDYIENEILPLVEQNAGVKITKNPSLRGVMGGSSGGSAGMAMVWLHPDRYTRAFLFSASLVKLWPTDGYPDGSWYYPAGAVGAAAKKNLRISLMVGENDINAGSGSMTDWRLANIKTAGQLIAKGYHYRYTLVKGGAHESPAALRQNVPTELAWAWRGWTEATP